MILYYSSPVTKNTERMALKLSRHPDVDMSIRRVDDPAVHPLPNEPHYLLFPSYGGTNSKLVPPQIVSFLNHYADRHRIVGVIGAGNRNFGEYFCAAAFVVARKLQVPILGLGELEGQPAEMDAIIAKLSDSIASEKHDEQK